MAIIQNKPNMNYGVWGSNGNIAVPTSEKVDLGWIIERPPNEVMNWLQNRQDSMLQFVNQRGIPTWDALTEYPLNAYVVRNGTLYKASSQNIDKDPTLNQSIWTVAFATYTDYSNLYNEVQSIKDVEGYLDLYVSKNNPVMLAETKGVGYKDSTGDSGVVFSGTTTQIESSGEVVAEFTGTESDKDVVTFDKLKEYLQTYKVGDLYLTTNISNPSVTLGYGTWSRYAEGRALVGFSSSTSNDFPEWVKSQGSTFGEYTNTLTVNNLPDRAYSYPADDELISAHNLTIDTTRAKTNYDASSSTSSQYASAWAYTRSNSTTGGVTLAHNITQPSISIYVWRRTA